MKSLCDSENNFLSNCSVANYTGWCIQSRTNENNRVHSPIIHMGETSVMEPRQTHHSEKIRIKWNQVEKKKNKGKRKKKKAEIKKNEKYLSKMILEKL